MGYLVDLWLEVKSGGMLPSKSLQKQLLRCSGLLLRAVAYIDFLTLDS